MAIDPEELARRREQDNPDPPRIVGENVAITLIGEFLKMLVDNGHLNEGEVVEKLDSIARQLMMSQTAENAAKGISFIKIVRELLAGKLRQPKPN
jgi:hypothetical protein